MIMMIITIDQIYEGTSEVQHLVIAGKLLKEAAKVRGWPTLQPCSLCHDSHPLTPLLCVCF
jgi:hypothetical protein